MKQTTIFGIFITLLVLTTTTTIVQARCPPGQHLLGGVCKVCSNERSPYGSYYTYKNEYCIHKLPKSKEKSTSPNYQKTTTITNQCLGDDVLAMFFSYVSYSEDYELLISKWFSDRDGYPRIKGCGRWLSVNSFHQQRSIYISAHASIFINPERKTVILAFRGTNFDFTSSRTWIDWFGNLYIVLSKCPFTNCGRVHKGFKSTYRLHKMELITQISEYLNNGYDLILTGHSQGASVAQIASIHYNEIFAEHRSRIKTYVFAAPRTGNSDFVKLYERLGNDRIRYSAVSGNSRDLVTSIPPEILFYKHPSPEVIIPCNRKYFGNPNPPKDIRIPGIFPRTLPLILGCHYQQVYLDGLIDMKKNINLQRDAKDAPKKLSKQDVDEFFNYYMNTQEQ